MDFSRAVTAVLFIWALLFSAGWCRPSLPETSNCDPNKSYTDGCNTCICHGDSGITCTRKMCFDESGKSTIGPIVEVKTNV